MIYLTFPYKMAIFTNVLKIAVGASMLCVIDIDASHHWNHYWRVYMIYVHSYLHYELIWNHWSPVHESSAY